MSEESELHAGGRPSDYLDSFVQQAEKLCLLGATDGEIADFFGVSVRTIYRWKLEHEEFCQAINAGKAKADERVVRSLYQKATGYDYVEEEAIKVKVEQHKEQVEVVEVSKHQPADTTAGIFWLKNRRPEEWRDKITQEVSGPNGAPIEVATHKPRDVAKALALILAKGMKDKSTATPQESADGNGD